MLSRKRAWTQDEDERLRAFVAQGASFVKVAAALKRKTISVRTRARALRCPFPPLRVTSRKEHIMPILLWLVGIPIPLIILIMLLHH
jgi:hypothetical protein